MDGWIGWDRRIDGMDGWMGGWMQCTAMKKETLVSVAVSHLCNSFYFFKYSPKDMFIDIRERGRERDSDVREKQSVTSQLRPDQESNWQTFDVRDNVPTNYTTPPGLTFVTLSCVCPVTGETPGRQAHVCIVHSCTLSSQQRAYHVTGPLNFLLSCPCF